MRRFRVSVRALMLGVLAVAVGLAALLSASRYWSDLFSTITFGLLLTAPLGIIYRRGTSRAFWVGIAVFGWIYNGTSEIWVSINPVRRSVMNIAESIHPLVDPPPRNPTLTGDYWDVATQRYVKVPAMGLWAGRAGQFSATANALSGLLVTLSGGWLAVWFERSRRRVDEGPRRDRAADRDP